MIMLVNLYKGDFRVRHKENHTYKEGFWGAEETPVTALITIKY